jgi:hypothetical protein
VVQALRVEPKHSIFRKDRSSQDQTRMERPRNTLSGRMVFVHFSKVNVRGSDGIAQSLTMSCYPYIFGRIGGSDHLRRQDSD